MAQRYLLDTHCLIWFQENNPQIPVRVMDLIQDAENVILFSQVSLFEITIKQTIGKLPGLDATIADIYTQAINDNFTFLPISNQHIYQYGSVPIKDDHRDPFDRLLIATAIEENATILSADKKFILYSNLLTVYW